MKNRPAIQILKRWLEGKASPEEIIRVDKWYSKEDAVRMMTPGKEMIREQLYNRIRAELETGPKVVPLSRRPFFRVAAAACIILLAGWSIYFMFYNKPAKKDEIVKTNVPAKDVKAPAINRAMITLVDGSTVYLDSVMNGQLAMQGNIKLVKLDNGQIAYQTSGGEILKEIQYNTLSNPRGSKVIDMQLSDGSHVWLNAGSSVTYPVAFIGNERKVSISGEAYFEVAHDATKPFYVSKGDMQVQVLGTHFNVNAYADEADIKVTLLEGSVKVSKGNANGLLKPGQQAQVSADPSANSGQVVKIVNAVNIEEVMAWKNGVFIMNKTDVATIMRQIAKWYDIEVNYQNGVPPGRISGDIPRTMNLSKVLEVMELSGVKFKIEGRKVIVIP